MIGKCTLFLSLFIHTCRHLHIWMWDHAPAGHWYRKVNTPAATISSSVFKEGKKKKISNLGQSMIFTSCCLQHPRRVHRVQYVRVCPRFPLPGSFPPGRLWWDGDWQKKGRREPIKEVLVLPLITKGAGISRRICLHCSPPRQCGCVTSCGCCKGK